MVASCAPHWGALLVSMHSFQARPGLPVSAWGRESAPLLHVSGTVPGAADRMRNHGRKTEMDNLNDINRELVESLQKKVVSGEIELTAIAPLDSFLGIKFGDNADKYRCGDGFEFEDTVNPLDGTFMMGANGNHFLSFEKLVVFASSDRKVVSVMAIDEQCYDDCEKHAGEVLRLLYKKYKIEPIEHRNDVDGNDIWLWIFPFYNPEIRRIVSSIILLSNHGNFALFARDEELFREMVYNKEQSELDAL